MIKIIIIFFEELLNLYIKNPHGIDYKFLIENSAFLLKNSGFIIDIINQNSNLISNILNKNSDFIGLYDEKEFLKFILKITKNVDIFSLYIIKLLYIIIKL